MRRVLLSYLCLLLPLALTSCWTPEPPAASMAQRDYALMEGDPKRGEVLLDSYGCIACHSVPGINDYNARVGPPLDDWADRRYIAGDLVNTPTNLKQWIQYPQVIEPGTAMPNLGVTDDDVDDIVAYLFTLGEDYDPIR